MPDDTGITLAEAKTQLALWMTADAAGADYAEYEHKSDACGEIAKGQGIGFDVAGKVTDKWAVAVSFGVKTTNPAYIGGDTWGRYSGDARCCTDI